MTDEFDDTRGRSSGRCEPGDVRPGVATAQIAHDLANHLQVAASAVHLAGNHSGRMQSADYAMLMQEAIGSLNRASLLVKRMLASSRSRSANEPIDLIEAEPVFVNSILTDMRHLIALAVGPYIEVEILCDAKIPFVYCRRDDLENVILNLVVNARDAMSGRGRLTLRAESETRAMADDWAREDVVLRVTDTGCGMSPSLAARAHEPFFTTKAETGGTGLGLAQVHAFAARLGGSASIVSIVDEGTSITVRLPGGGS